MDRALCSANVVGSVVTLGQKQPRMATIGNNQGNCLLGPKHYGVLFEWLLR